MERHLLNKAFRKEQRQQQCSEISKRVVYWGKNNQKNLFPFLPEYQF